MTDEVGARSGEALEGAGAGQGDRPVPYLGRCPVVFKEPEDCPLSPPVIRLTARESRFVARMLRTTMRMTGNEELFNDAKQWAELLERAAERGGLEPQRRKTERES